MKGQLTVFRSHRPLSITRLDLLVLGTAKTAASASVEQIRKVLHGHDE